jgi:hypothetical protein
VLIDHGKNIIDNISEDEIIKPQIYPNPAKDKVTVTAPFNIDKIEFTSINGTIVKTVFPGLGGNCVEIDLALSSGIYFIKTYNKLHTSVLRLIVL